MAAYEVVREIQNLCRNNQMRDVFFDEVETDDPESYVRTMFKAEKAELTVTRGTTAASPFFAASDGLTQKFLFYPID